MTVSVTPQTKLLMNTLWDKCFSLVPTCYVEDHDGPLIREVANGNEYSEDEADSGQNVETDDGEPAAVVE